MKDSTGAYLAPPAQLLPMLTTKQIPITNTTGSSSDTSEIYTAQWDQLLIGMRTDLRIEFLRERFLADNLQYAFLAYLRADVQLAHPAAFVVDTGVRG
jgi:HK97 family phage major capsid protein